MMEGYGNFPETARSVHDASLDLIKLRDVELFVPGGCFAGNELAYLYVETFGDWRSNPHAFEHPAMIIRPGSVVVDAGACEGLFTLLSLRRGADQVHIFEPTQALCNSLKLTFDSYGASSKVFINEAGLGECGGMTGFAVDPVHASMSRVDARGDGKVRLYSLDEYVEERGIERIDFIKMDIEGAEVSAVAGCEKSLRRWRPALSIAVYHEYENAFRIKDYLAGLSLNYRIVFGGCFMAAKPFRPYMLYAIPTTK